MAHHGKLSSGKRSLQTLQAAIGGVALTAEGLATLSEDRVHTGPQERRKSDWQQTSDGQQKAHFPRKTRHASELNLVGGESEGASIKKIEHAITRKSKYATPRKVAHETVGKIRYANGRRVWSATTRRLEQTAARKVYHRLSEQSMLSPKVKKNDEFGQHQAQENAEAIDDTVKKALRLPPSRIKSNNGSYSRSFRKILLKGATITKLDGRVSNARILRHVVRDIRPAIQIRARRQHFVPKKLSNLRQKSAVFTGRQNVPEYSFFYSLGQMKMLSEDLGRSEGEQTQVMPATCEETQVEDSTKMSIVEEGQFCDQHTPRSRLDDAMPGLIYDARFQELDDKTLAETPEKGTDTSWTPFHSTRPLFMPTRPFLQDLQNPVNRMDGENAANIQDQRAESALKSNRERMTTGKQMHLATAEKEEGQPIADLPPGPIASTPSIDDITTNEEYEGVYIPLVDQSEGLGETVPWMSQADAKGFSGRALYAHNPLLFGLPAH